jgi:hypothetical protein
MPEIASGLILDTPFGGELPVRLIAMRYTQNSAPALIAVSDDEVAEPVATLSVNLPDKTQTLSPGEFFCKDWSENEGMCDWLEENKIAYRTGRGAITGFVFAEIMKYSPEIQAIINQNMDS